MNWSIFSKISYSHAYCIRLCKIFLTFVNTMHSNWILRHTYFSTTLPMKHHIILLHVLSSYLYSYHYLEFYIDCDAALSLQNHSLDIFYHRMLGISHFVLLCFSLWYMMSIKENLLHLNITIQYNLVITSEKGMEIWYTIQQNFFAMKYSSNHLEIEFFRLFYDSNWYSNLFLLLVEKTDPKINIIWHNLLSSY